MPVIRLLVDVPGSPGERGVSGYRGDMLDVDQKTALVWADGERAERVIERSRSIERAISEKITP